MELFWSKKFRKENVHFSSRIFPMRRRPRVAEVTRLKILNMRYMIFLCFYWVLKNLVDSKSGKNHDGCQNNPHFGALSEKNKS